MLLDPDIEILATPKISPTSQLLSNKNNNYFRNVWIFYLLHHLNILHDVSVLITAGERVGLVLLFDLHHFPSQRHILGI